MEGAHALGLTPLPFVTQPLAQTTIQCHAPVATYKIYEFPASGQVVIKIEGQNRPNRYQDTRHTLLVYLTFAYGLFHNAGDAWTEISKFVDELKPGNVVTIGMIKKAMSRDRKQRYATAEAMLAALEAEESDESDQESEESQPPSQGSGGGGCGSTYGSGSGYGPS